VGTDGQTVNRAAPAEKASGRKRRPLLLLRLFLANAVVLVVAALLLILTPVTISAPVTLGQLALIVGAVVAMLIATLLLLRRALSPWRSSPR
jgi:two-component system sensor histidine kinase UhpB